MIRYRDDDACFSHFDYLPGAGNYADKRPFYGYQAELRPLVRFHGRYAADRLGTAKFSKKYAVFITAGFLRPPIIAVMIDVNRTAYDGCR